MSKKRRKGSKVITRLTLSSGRIVTDPEEINLLLIADGFTIDADGKLGLSDRLKKRPN